MRPRDRLCVPPYIHTHTHTASAGRRTTVKSKGNVVTSLERVREQDETDGQGSPTAGHRMGGSVEEVERTALSHPAAVS